MHMPDNVSFEAAATTGVGIGTTGYALYKVLGLPLPDSTASNESSQTEARDTVLIYGGSTATGSIAIQLAKLYASRIRQTIRYRLMRSSRSDVKVVVTCSPKHFDLMKKRGADLVYDYVSSSRPNNLRSKLTSSA
jgi:NADPH:quinone reductase-like Zn-dependent oxidoreductase